MQETVACTLWSGVMLCLLATQDACRSCAQFELPDGPCHGEGQAPLLGCCLGFSHTPQGIGFPQTQSVVLAAGAITLHAWHATILCVWHAITSYVWHATILSTFLSTTYNKNLKEAGGWLL